MAAGGCCRACGESGPLTRGVTLSRRPTVAATVDRPSHRVTRVALTGVALFEASKGLAALAALLGWLSLMHHDVHRLAAELIGHFHLEPTAHYPALLLRGIDALNVTPLRTTVLLGAAYIGLRGFEAYGLWRDRAWGQWLGALGGAIYVPFELLHLWHDPTWQSVTVLACNVALVGFLGARLWMRRTLADVARRAGA